MPHAADLPARLHLHFEVREDGDPVDPMTYVDVP